MGKTEKNPKENHATEMTKIPKTKKTKIWDEQNIVIHKRRHQQLDNCKNL